jgi:hypothetical protein
MSDSYPIIQDSLSDMQKEFMGCVETHLDPPEQEQTSYRVEALFRLREGEGEAEPGGDAVRFAVSVDETDPDISERRHMIEFISMEAPERPVARVVHSMKRVESSQGRFFWTESQFRVHSPEFPTEQARQDHVEREVRTYVERVKALDRERKLVEV